MILQHSRCLQAYKPGEKLTHAKRWVLDKQPLSKTILEAVWSPIVWNTGRRRKDNFLYADWLVLDFDNTMPLENAVNNYFCDMVHLIGTTQSHTDCEPCFRVCVPFERRITQLDLYEGNLRYYAEKYGSDPAPTHGAALFKPCTKIISLKRDGFSADVLEKRRETRDDWDGKLQPISYFAVSVLARDEIGEGERDSTAFRFAKDLLKTGMSHSQVLQTLKRVRFNPKLSDHYLEIKVQSATNSLRRENGQKEKAAAAKTRVTSNNYHVHGDAKRRGGHAP